MKKSVALAIIAIVALAAVAVVVAENLRRVETRPAVFCEIIVNGKKIGGGEWEVLPAEIFETEGRPLDTLEVNVKLRWSVKYLGEEEWNRPVPVKFFATVLWKIKGPFAWFPSLKFPPEKYGDNLHYDEELTYIPTEEPLDNIFRLLAQAFGDRYWKDVMKEYCSVAVSSTGNWVTSLFLPVGSWSNSFLFAVFEGKFIRKAMQYEGRLFKEDPETELAYGGALQGTWLDWWEDLITYIQEQIGLRAGATQLRDGQIVQLYHLSKKGYELQNDLSKLVFDFNLYTLQHKHLVVDRPGDEITLELWIFVWYQWQDVNKKWSDVYYGAKKLATLKIKVEKGTWVTVSVQVAKDFIVKGAWVIHP